VLPDLGEHFFVPRDLVVVALVVNRPPELADEVVVVRDDNQLKVPGRAVPVLTLVDLGRDSPIVKHYSSIKNSSFVTCVNSALCS
jgi:hypothetical protein